MKNICKLGVLFMIGAIIYIVIELLWDGSTHWTMGLLGGICFTVIGGLNEHFSWELVFWKQCLYGSITITTLEFVFGMVLNVWLKLNIWDYSNLPCNLYGQVCLSFSAMWFFLSGVAVILDDWLRYWLFNEEKPYYRIW